MSALLFENNLQSGLTKNNPLALSSKKFKSMNPLLEDEKNKGATQRPLFLTYKIQIKK